MQALQKTEGDLMYEQGSILGGLHQLGAGAGVPAEHHLPASLPLQDSSIGMGAVHHQH